MSFIAESLLRLSLQARKEISTPKEQADSIITKHRITVSSLAKGAWQSCFYPIMHNLLF